MICMLLTDCLPLPSGLLVCLCLSALRACLPLCMSGLLACMYWCTLTVCLFSSSSVCVQFVRPHTKFSFASSLEGQMFPSVEMYFRPPRPLSVQNSISSTNKLGIRATTSSSPFALNPHHDISVRLSQSISPSPHLMIST